MNHPFKQHPMYTQVTHVNNKIGYIWKSNRISANAINEIQNIKFIRCISTHRLIGTNKFA